RHGDRVVPFRQTVAAVVEERFALKRQVNLDDAGALRAGEPAGLQVRGPALRQGFIDRRSDVQERDQPAVRALPHLDVRFVALLADDRGEERLFGDVCALLNSGSITIDQAGQENLVQAGDELVLEGWPQGFVFQVRVHSGEGGRHGARLPRGPARRAGRGG